MTATEVPDGGVAFCQLCVDCKRWESNPAITSLMSIIDGEAGLGHRVVSC